MHQLVLQGAADQQTTTGSTVVPQTLGKLTLFVHGRLDILLIFIYETYHYISKTLITTVSLH